MKINIIGAGRLGKTIAKLIVTNNAATLASVYNTTEASNNAALNFIQAGTGCTTLSQLAPADLTLITTPDSAIETTCEHLVTHSLLKEKSVVAHTSGVLSSEVLKSARQLNCSLASVHPMKSFADPELAANTFSHTFCAIEGDTQAVSMLTPLFNTLGAKLFTLNKQKKGCYHAAGVISSNFLVTLYDSAMQCLLNADIDAETAHAITLSLMQGTLTNLNQLKEAKAALTGPLKRGDIDTIRLHCQALKGELSTVYKVLSQASIKLTDHSEAFKKELHDLCQA